jgi:hypothetical protein
MTVHSQLSWEKQFQISVLLSSHRNEILITKTKSSSPERILFVLERDM